MTRCKLQRNHQPCLSDWCCVRNTEGLPELAHDDIRDSEFGPGESIRLSRCLPSLLFILCLIVGSCPTASTVAVVSAYKLNPQITLSKAQGPSEVGVWHCKSRIKGARWADKSDSFLQVIPPSCGAWNPVALFPSRLRDKQKGRIVTVKGASLHLSHDPQANSSCYRYAN